MWEYQREPQCEVTGIKSTHFVSGIVLWGGGTVISKKTADEQVPG